MQIFTTYHEMTVYFMVLIIWTILCSCKWYQSTGNIFIDISVMGKSMEKIVEISGSLPIFKILENIENSFTEVNSSH